ncbi:MAG: hypothetical protein SOU07_06720 [Bacilli bacterium]|nr:hypothetical protein [Acholeplasmataceae bacterium]MDY2903114.1 hypothetical protein [Bacilli bacterium]
MKCKRCGKVFNENVEVCDECGYNFVQGEKDSKLYDEKKDPQVSEQNKFDLIDYPILSFVFSVVGLVIPVFVLSALAIHLSKKPAKSSLIPFSKLGFIFGILGLVVSLLVISMVLIYLMG